MFFYIDPYFDKSKDGKRSAGIAVLALVQVGPGQFFWTPLPGQFVFCDICNRPVRHKECVSFFDTLIECYNCIGAQRRPNPIVKALDYPKRPS